MGGTNICSNASLNTTLSVGQWAHISITVGTLASLYKNGELVVSRMIVGSLDYGNGSAPFRVGVGTERNSNLVDTSLDEIRFWSTVINQSQISNNYLVSFTLPTPTSLFAYWRFNQNSPTIVNDDSNYDRLVEIIGTAYSSNCMVAKCLCDLDQHCVPNRDKLDCPSSTTSSSQVTTSTTTSQITSETSTTDLTTETTQQDTTEIHNETTTTRDTNSSSGISILIWLMNMMIIYL